MGRTPISKEESPCRRYMQLTLHVGPVEWTHVCLAGSQPLTFKLTMQNSVPCGLWRPSPHPRARQFNLPCLHPLLVLPDFDMEIRRTAVSRAHRYNLPVREMALRISYSALNQWLFVISDNIMTIDQSEKGNKVFYCRKHRTGAIICSIWGVILACHRARIFARVNKEGLGQKFGRRIAACSWVPQHQSCQWLAGCRWLTCSYHTAFPLSE